MNFLKRILNFFTSLRLTVVCLSMAMALVFFGTIAQVKLGLYIAQERYFESMFVWWQPPVLAFQIPVWPGGYLLGGLLLINLIAAQVRRFSFTRKKIGIYITHLGLILLFVGQFATQLLQVETFMSIREGGSKNYSESGRYSELAVIDKSATDTDKVIAIPESLLGREKEIHHADLPFTIKVLSYFQNSNLSLAGGKFEYAPKDRAIKMNDQDVPATTVEIIPQNGAPIHKTLSRWVTDRNLLNFLHGPKGFGNAMPADVEKPETITVDGRTYEIALRPKRFYKPVLIQLLNFTHEIYPGTDIPKDFSSRVRLQNPQKAEDREVLIYMNNPLRYAGETYYQGGYDEDDGGTILQVVRNPGWLTPYVSCAMVAGGLLVQFLTHLVGFAKKRKK